MLEHFILKTGYGISYGSAALKSLKSHNVPELDLLVREAIQNSSDAALEQEGDSFRVSFNTGMFEPSRLNFYITDLENTLNQRFPEQQAEFMEIRDTKTSGLTGGIRKAQLPKDDHGNFFKLIFDTGKQQNQSGAGGNFGFGKSVYYRVGIGIVIFYSRIKSGEGFESRLIVTLVEDETKPDALLNAICQDSEGKAWWGIKDGEDLLPITDQDSEFITAVLNIFGVQEFKGTETGTSIIIPYINSRKLLEDIIPNEADVREDVKQAFRSMYGSGLDDYLELAVQKWYCPKIHNRELNRLNSKKCKWLSVSINNRNINKNNLLPFFDLIQELYTTAIFKTYGKDYVSNRYPGIITQPVNIRDYLENGSTSGYVAIIKIAKSDLYNDSMSLSPYDYIGKFEADCNDPIVMYTRDPGMIIDYSTTDAWVKGIPMPTNQDEYLFAFYMPDTGKTIKSNLSVKEYAGQTLGEYLRACEKAEHMSWEDPAKMQIVRRIQRITVDRIKNQICAEETEKIEATASKLSGKLGRMLLPRVGYAKGVRGQGGGGGAGGDTKMKDVSFEILSQLFNGNDMILDFKLKLSHAKKTADIAVIVDSEGGRIDPTAWQKDIGTPFPASITELVVHTVASKVMETPIAVEMACNPDKPQIAGDYITVDLERAADSLQHTSFKVNASIFNLELNGTITIRARDKKYNFSVRVI